MKIDWKKSLSLIIATVIVWIFASVVFYLVGGKVFDSDYFDDWTNDVALGLSCALAGLLGPTIAAAVDRKLRGRKK